VLALFLCFTFAGAALASTGGGGGGGGGGVSVSGDTYMVLAVDMPISSGVDGWAVLSTPVTMATGQKCIGDTLKPSNIGIAYRFNSTTQQWEQVTTETMTPLDAVYVKTKGSTNIIIRPSTEITSPPVRVLSKGWNLISPTDSRSLDSALYSIKGCWDTIISPLNGTWAVTPNQTSELSTRKMKLHQGYWIYMNSPGTLTGFSSTPVYVFDYHLS
jgi:hypothetical protein